MFFAEESFDIVRIEGFDRTTEVLEDHPMADPVVEDTAHSLRWMLRLHCSCAPTFSLVALTLLVCEYLFPVDVKCL